MRNELAVDALAAYRLTRLVTRDKITARWRGSIVKQAYVDAATDPEELERLLASMHDLDSWALLPTFDEHAPRRAEFVTCPFCVGMYVAFGVLAARIVAPRLWNPIARALAVSATTGLIATRLDAR